MTNRNTHPTGILGVRQSSIAHSTSSERTSAGKIRSILMSLLLSPTLAFGYPFQLNWTDMNADEDGTIIYREISGVFHEVGFVGRNVTSFTDDRREPAVIHFAGSYGRFVKVTSPARLMKPARACQQHRQIHDLQSQDSAKAKVDDTAGL
jgi:hypothetical protein